MKILLYGVSHQTTPIEIRERYTIKDEDVPQQLNEIKQFTGVSEVVILTTCNRTEYYLYIDQTEFMHGDMLRYIGEYTGYDVSDVIATSYGKSNSDVAQHLFKVATGLDSLMVGETQILSQVKNAFEVAHTEKAVGPILSSLFNKAISFSKKVHTKTTLDQNSFNPSTAAIQLLKEEWGDFKAKRVLLIGAGKMIRLAARSLLQNDAEHITVVSRNSIRAEHFAHELNEWAQDEYHPEKLKRYVYSADMDNLSRVLAGSDAVIVATKSSDYIITSESIIGMQDIRNGVVKELLLMDLAIPRNVDPDLSLIQGLRIFDMDQIGIQIDQFREEREKIVKQILAEIDEAVLRFNSWYQERRAVPYIYQLRKGSMDIRERTMDSLAKKLPELNEREARIIDKHMQSIVNQLIKHPIQSMKELARMNPSKDMNDALEVFARSVGIDLEVKCEIPTEDISIVVEQEEEL
ncbi:glutamyl-tRNA reductase [Carnobacterium gallinarum]|uniref:glutamyl-tRNA reductase n=1 Tax=Carnobacterium gallinarum TaxID=2749 RepID=UPI00054F8C7A|nr:glutamyl-tRNA reductase [Carnobacterium gallinarum]